MNILKPGRMSGGDQTHYSALLSTGNSCSCQVYQHQEKLCRSEKGVFLKNTRREKIGYILRSAFISVPDCPEVIVTSPLQKT